MLTDYFSCYKLNKTSTPFQEEKNSFKLKICQIFHVIRVLGYTKISKRKKSYIFKCIPEIVSAYHTGSAFTQHYPRLKKINPLINEITHY